MEEEGNDLKPPNGKAPFVGPRPVPPGRALYGRDREILALSCQLTSDRVVLLYSPSGAGKTSLLQAALFPRLNLQGYAVLPTIRLNHPPPAPDVNRFLASALLSLESGLSTEALLGKLRQNPGDGTSLLEIAIAACESQLLEADDKKRRRKVHPSLLILDQFEEVLTLAPEDIEAQRTFFHQLGQVLKNSERWALLAMREDRVAELDPHLHHFPGRLSSSFRLDLLRPAAARDAIQRPLSDVGAEISDDALKELVDDLAGTAQDRPSTPPGEKTEVGVIEPVYLQVVCEMLWERKRGSSLPIRITKDDLTKLRVDGMENVKGVSAALVLYYNQKLDKVPGPTIGKEVREGLVRNWFDERLLSKQGIRLLSSEEEAIKAGLSSDILQYLVDSYLIRGERRHGLMWYELSHDRMVRPVRASNDIWRKGLSDFQRQADLWRQHRSADLLVSGDVLEEGRRLQKEWPERLSPTDQEFLVACENRVRRQKTKSLLYLATSFLIVVAVSFGSYEKFSEQKRKANAETQRADEELAKREQAEKEKKREVLVANIFRELEQAQYFLADHPRKSAEHARTALLLAREGRPEAAHQAENLLREALANAPMRLIGMHAAPIRKLLLDPNGAWLLSQGTDGSLLYWDLRPEKAKPVGKEMTPITFTPKNAIATTVVATVDGKWIVVGDNKGSVHLWLTGGDKKQPEASFLLAPPTMGTPQEITALAVNQPVGEGGKLRMAAGASDGTIGFFRFDKPYLLTSWKAANGVAIRQLTITPNPKQLYIGESTGKVRNWEIQELQDNKSATAQMSKFDWTVKDNITTMTISPYSSAQGALHIVVGTTAGEVQATNVVLNEKIPKGTLIPIRGAIRYQGLINSLVFSADATLFLTTDVTGVAGMYSMKGTSITFRTEVGGERRVPFENAAFSSDSKWLAAGSGDGVVHVWSIGDIASPPLSVKGSESSSRAVAVTRKGATVYVGSADGKVRTWDLVTFRNPARTEPVWQPAPPKDPMEVFFPEWPGFEKGGWKTKIGEWPTHIKWDAPNNLFAYAGTTFSGSDIILCDIKSTKIRAINTGHVGAVGTFVFFSTDGLVSGGKDGTLRLWRSKPWEADRAIVLRGHTGPVTNLEVSKDGKTLTSTSSDGSTRTWALTVDDLLKKADAILGPVKVE